MSMSDMNANSTMSSSLMPASDMAMVFFSASNTPLFSTAWTPSSSGAYAGTCIFLVMFSIIHRALIACKSILESRWRDQAWHRRYVVVADRLSLAEKLADKAAAAAAGADADSTTGVLSANGVEENVRMIRHEGHGPMPWRFSVDLPRSLMSTVISGVGYLLMLAVMTLNVGYFLSVLAGVLVGELMVGRYSSSLDAHH